MNDKCLRCGLPEDHPKHDPEARHPEGWHPYRGIDYLNALEDALLFVREKGTPHQWYVTGAIIATSPSFEQKICTVCGSQNWGGKEDGICFGSNLAEQGSIAAHNRRAVKGWTFSKVTVK